MFEVGRVGRVGEIVAYMYQWDRIPYNTYCVEYDKVGDMGVRVTCRYATVWCGGVWVREVMDVIFTSLQQYLSHFKTMEG